MTIKNTIKQQINQVLLDKYNLTKINFRVEYPPSAEMGDYSCNVAMLLTKKLGKSPLEIGKEIIKLLSYLKTHQSEKKGFKNKEIPEYKFSKLEVITPGFINFYLNEKVLVASVNNILKLKDNFGKLKNVKPQKIQIEFISANPTGPLTLANGRGGFSGDVLANVLILAGNKVEREYYVNDTGNQIKELSKSITDDGYSGYKGDYIDELRNELLKKQKNKHSKFSNLNNDFDDKIGKWAADIILKKYIKPAIKKTGIKFDNYYSERKMHETEKVDKMLETLKERKLVYRKDGAMWLKTKKMAIEKQNNNQDRVLVKSDGSKTYFLADIAYHWDKFYERKFDKVINLWGADHHGYVPRMKTAMAIIGYPGQLEILLMQLVRLIENGREKRMSKRAGVYVLLEKLINKVGLDATRFFFLMHANNKAMDFDLKLAKEKSSKNPVYYVQYAHARICSIIKKTNKLQFTKATIKLELVEKALIKELIKWPELIDEVANNYEVHKIPFYAIALADKFHDFYEHCRVIEKNKVIKSRLKLIQATKQVLKNILATLGVNTPEKM